MLCMGLPDAGVNMYSGHGMGPFVQGSVLSGRVSESQSFQVASSLFTEYGYEEQIKAPAIVRAWPVDKVFFLFF